MLRLQLAGLLILCLLPGTSACRKGTVAEFPASPQLNPPQSRADSKSRNNVLEGRVVSVSDGDTLTVRDKHDRDHRVRLIGIDAPERGQDFGKASRQELAKLVSNKKCTIEYDKIDQFGRLLGRVIVDDKDVNLEQVRSGFAWHYPKERDLGIDERFALETAEAVAKTERRGLWQQSTAWPPWEFRRSVRSESRTPDF